MNAVRIRLILQRNALFTKKLNMPLTCAKKSQEFSVFISVFAVNKIISQQKRRPTKNSDTYI